MSGDDFHLLTSLPLSSAVLCANCETISNSGDVCRCCGSTAVMSLSGLLGTLHGGSSARVIDPDWSPPREMPREVPKMRPRRAA